MSTRRTVTVSLAVAFVLLLVGGSIVALGAANAMNRTRITAYFENSNGLFPGDEIRVLGVPVGRIEEIHPEATQAKIIFWVEDKYKIPADAEAAIVSPQLVTARAIQLTPAYTTGPAMSDGATIPEERTAVPLEWDDLRAQLEKLTNALQPTQPGGVSTLGAFVNTAAENLRGQGTDIRETVIQMSKALSALGDHSGDMFTTIKNLSLVVSALEDSSTLLSNLNRNLAAVTGLLADNPDAVGHAIRDLNSVVGDATRFVSDNREALGTATDKLASISTSVNNSLPDIKQALHVFPNAAANFANVYQPAQGALTGALAVNNLADPVSLLCGSIAAAAREGANQSAKLCVQYLTPIVKNRQYNFLPVGVNPFVGAAARPNEIDWSEDRLRPDFVPPAEPAPTAAPALDTAPPVPAPQPLAPNSAVSTNPAAGLPGMLLPAEGGS